MLLKMPHRRFLIFLFLSLHLIGAHYTYAQVPYDRWFESLTGRSLNSLLGWERNNFDRAVHFSYGLLLAYPVREVFQRDFIAERNESLRVKNSRPLGEDEMRRLLNRGDAA